MNKYEVMVIVKPAEEEATNAVIEKVEALIARVGGTVEKVDRWGKRRLAYAVKKFTDGFYVLINFEAAPAEIKEIDRVLKMLLAPPSKVLSSLCFHSSVMSD